MLKRQLADRCERPHESALNIKGSGSQGQYSTFNILVPSQDVAAVHAYLAQGGARAGKSSTVGPSLES